MKNSGDYIENTHHDVLVDDHPLKAVTCEGLHKFLCFFDVVGEEEVENLWMVDGCGSVGW